MFRFIPAAVLALPFAIATPVSMAAPAPHAVAAVDDLRIEDSARDGALELRVTYPEDGGPFPVIVFSHGAGGTRDDYQPLVRHWAAQGYVVLQVNHGDAGVRGPSGYKHWASRPGDVSAVLDYLDDVEARVPALRGRLDRARIGVGGHSFGGQTTAMIGGYRLGGGTSYRDERVKALLMLAPPGNAQNDTPRNWAEIRLPLLVVLGGKDAGRMNEGPPWRMEAFRRASSEDAYLVVLDDADHSLGGMTGRTGEGRVGPVPEELALVLETTTRFWDAYLKREPDACRKLGTGELAAQSEIPVRFESRSGLRLRSASATDELAPATQSTSMVARFDANRDGVVSRDEAPERMADRNFDMLDRDGDGALSESEMTALVERMGERRGSGRGGQRGARGAGAGAAPAVEDMAPITRTKSGESAVCHPAP